jgi:hypothetical protein
MTLSDAIKAAVHQSYVATATYVVSAKGSTSAEVLAIQLANARKAERLAVAALSAHRVEHGC